MIDADFIEIPLQDLETAVAMLDNLSVIRLRDYPKCERFGERIAEALFQGLPVRVHSREADAMAPELRWRIPLAEAPQPWRSRIDACLRRIADRFGSRYAPERVEFVI